ncbi:unnamed protein product, partial [Effrenium voratum]
QEATVVGVEAAIDGLAETDRESDSSIMVMDTRDADRVMPPNSGLHLTLFANYTLDGTKVVLVLAIDSETGSPCGGWDGPTATALSHPQFQPFLWPLMRDTSASYVDVKLYNGNEVLLHWVFRGYWSDIDLSAQVGRRSYSVGPHGTVYAGDHCRSQLRVVDRGSDDAIGNDADRVEFRFRRAATRVEGPEHVEQFAQEGNFHIIASSPLFRQDAKIVNPEALAERDATNRAAEEVRRAQASSSEGQTILVDTLSTNTGMEQIESRAVAPRPVFVSVAGEDGHVVSDIRDQVRADRVRSTAQITPALFAQAVGQRVINPAHRPVIEEVPLAAESSPEEAQPSSDPNPLAKILALPLFDQPFRDALGSAAMDQSERLMAINGDEPWELIQLLPAMDPSAEAEEVLAQRLRMIDTLFALIKASRRIIVADPRADQQVSDHTKKFSLLQPVGARDGSRALRTVPQRFLSTFVCQTIPTRPSAVISNESGEDQSTQLQAITFRKCRAREDTGSCSRKVTFGFLIAKPSVAKGAETIESAFLLVQKVHWWLGARFDQEKLQFSGQPVILGVTYDLEGLILKIKQDLGLAACGWTTARLATLDDLPKRGLRELGREATVEEFFQKVKECGSTGRIFRREMVAEVVDLEAPPCRKGKAPLARWPCRLSRLVGRAGDNMDLRDRAERSERTRWTVMLKRIIVESELPAAEGWNADPDGTAWHRIGKGRRSTTLRKHVKTWRHVATWLYSTFNVPWPRTIEQFIEYIMHRVAVPEKERLRKHPALQNTLEEVNLELGSLDLRGRRQAVQIPVEIIMAMERYVMMEGGMPFGKLEMSGRGLRGVVERTKTTGAGKKVEIQHVFISAEA